MSNEKRPADNIKMKEKVGGNKIQHKFMPSVFSTTNVTVTDDKNYTMSVHPSATIPSQIHTGAMDSALSDRLSGTFNYGGSIASQTIMSWYSSQGFIGHQSCAIIAQHWLVARACKVPAEDAIRKGFKITVNDNTEVEPEIISRIEELDQSVYKINRNLIEFLYFNRVFGIRVALFVVDSADPDYYENPFNLDGVKPGTYKGISQIDPQWMSPLLNASASADPSSKDYYEPTWWTIGGMGGVSRVHKSHLAIIRGDEVADLLKPTYQYGGVSLTQQIYERVYAA